MSDCWGCQKHTETGLNGFVAADCMDCVAREIAHGPAAAKRQADGGAGVLAEMRKAWPDTADFKQGRSRVWAQIQKKEGEAA